MSFTHLHRHSEFSRLDGIGTAKQYADRAAELGQGALALTDHGTLSGALHHIQACRKAGLLPIMGVEAYFRPNRALAKKLKDRRAWHLCLFAKNLRGWHNLLRIVSTAYGEPEDGGGFYDKPCVDFELLERYHEGIVCTSACVSSWMSHLIDGGDSAAVRDYIDRMLNLFGEDFWIEIMPHDFDRQRVLNIEIVRLAHERSIPLIATNDAHFPYKEWADTHRIAKIMGSGSTLKKAQQDHESGKADYLAELNPTLYLAHEEEMRMWFQKAHPNLPVEVIDEAIDNTALFVQRTTPFLLDKTNKLPRITKSIDESEALLREWIGEGMDRIEGRFLNEQTYDPHKHAVRMAEYWDRVEEEFATLKNKGVLDYFVLVGMICRWAKQNGIRVGLGRGSAAGCLVSYLIGVTAIDPLPYGLLFERFLNPERKGLPDIDLDFDSERRAEVKAYIANDLFTPEHVADIITHQRFQPKKVLQDLCRVCDVPYLEAHALTDTIEIRQDDEETTLEELLPFNEKLQEFKRNNPGIWMQALRLEGQVANAGKHAAGIIITPKPVSDYMALERGKKGDLVTSWSDAADFPVVSDHGFVKIDALGIKGLTKHEYACKLIAKRFGEAPDLASLSALYNPSAVESDVMDIFRRGHTIGIFQFGGRGITSLLREIQPDDILDLAAANALYRPGPMKGGVHRQYAKRKHGEEPIDYWHDSIRPVLEETYGVIAYQEQVMEIAKQIGGFSGGEADDLRKAMGKLYRIKGGTAAKDYMRRFEQKWFEGAQRRGLDRKTADEIWHKLLEFGHYGFNKSHSASYALIAYMDAYLKAKYPAEFYAAFLTYESDEEKANVAIREASMRGIDIVLPDVNISDSGYTVDAEGRLLLGLTAIKGVGERAAQKIIKGRPYVSFDDFLTRSDSAVPIRPLIESGALDSIGANRAFLLSVCVKPGRSEKEWFVWEHLKHNTKLKNGPREVPVERREPSAEDVNRMQSACLNMSLSSIVLPDAQRTYIEANIFTPDELEAVAKGVRVVVGGEISKVAIKKTKRGARFANVTLVYGPHQWLVRFWERELLIFEEILTQGRVIMVEGRKDEWNGHISVTANEAIDIYALVTA